MSGKLRVTNISAVGIIYRKENPREIFIEVKDDGHPIKLVRRQLCFIGGNWVGVNAEEDFGPEETFKREIEEELSFDRPLRNSVELSDLGMADKGTFEPTPISASPTNEERHVLSDLKTDVDELARPFGSWLNTVTREALDSADPENKRGGFTTLATYFIVPLREVQWERLAMLQTRFKNLSNESITLITSLEEIVSTGMRTSFGHDRVLKSFFLSQGFAEAEKFPLVPGVESVAIGLPLDSYDKYLQRFEVDKRPG